MVHPGTELYGSDRVFLDSAIALKHLNWRVAVALPGTGPLADALELQGLDVSTCPTPVLRKSALRPAGLVRLIGTSLRSLSSGLALLRAERPDVVYVSTVTIPLWTVLARLRRIPVVCHVHEAETGSSKLLQRLLALPLLATSWILINSEFSRSTLLGTFRQLEARTEVIQNPVDGPGEVVPARTDLEESVALLFIGRLSPRKGPDVAVRALAALERRGVPARLELLGSVFQGYEWFESDLHAEVERLGLGARTRFLGFVDDVWPTIQRADIVLVPSVADEPFGNTAVEAILAARPVVASTSGGLVEAVSGYASARSVSPGNAEELADAVMDIVDAWPAMSTAALEDASVAADRHSPRRYGERLDAALRNVVSRRAPRL